jgi:hypothetical protein
MFRRPGGELDVMQVQRVLEKNKELELVVSSLPLVPRDEKLMNRGGGCDRTNDQELSVIQFERY